MKAVDPEWEWHTGVVPPPPPLGESGGRSSAWNEPSEEQRGQRMREGVYQSPCQNVFTPEFRRSKHWNNWKRVRDSWIDDSLDREDDAEAVQAPAAHAYLGHVRQSAMVMVK